MVQQSLVSTCHALFGHILSVCLRCYVLPQPPRRGGTCELGKSDHCDQRHLFSDRSICHCVSMHHFSKCQDCFPTVSSGERFQSFRWNIIEAHSIHFKSWDSPLPSSDTSVGNVHLGLQDWRGSYGGIFFLERLLIFQCVPCRAERSSLYQRE